MLKELECQKYFSIRNKVTQFKYLPKIQTITLNK